ncbi:nitrogen fixation protein NifQ [Methylocystis parvus]|uniref:Nitrogen fixation protein NifQ n=1 Tax=Methylocystis parvus TaxID=134 RepID=A0A6B8M5W0_9HYPH|nr:nitrogen fixation protein NifQ [Methylocystis parvus]QGM99394.1 nitrogen fixation protein NifQ [Methylocystis parvus]WBK00214.1 nitrogen fixation protein NifQ [Methylocystis parvus OBBP]
MTMLAPPHELMAGARLAPAAETVYLAIRAEQTPRALAAPFTAHILACMLTISIVEAHESGEPLSASLGLDRRALDFLTAQWAPGARRFIDLDGEPERLSLDEEETQVLDLLTRFKSDSAPLSAWIASIVARRAMSPRHLWQDLGLIERAELTRLMSEWFPALAAANVDNMKWKKFFYRQLCELEGFSLCAAPTCRECGDFDNCFGEEDGASALARLAQR